MPAFLVVEAGEDRTGEPPGVDPRKEMVRDSTGILSVGRWRWPRKVYSATFLNTSSRAASFGGGAWSSPARPYSAS